MQQNQVNQDTWSPPFSIKIMENFLEDKYHTFMQNMIKTCKFVEATQGVGCKNVVQTQHKIRMDYTLSNHECRYIDEPLIEKADCDCNLRERWRLLYYDGNNKSFRDPHRDWTRHACHRRMSIIIGLSDPADYEGGEFVFAEKNIQYKIEKGAAVIFDSRMLHEVLPVTKGKRFVLQAFLFNDSGYKLRKTQNDIHQFSLMRYDPSLGNVININNTQERLSVSVGKNAAHSRIKSTEDSFIGDFTDINDVVCYVNSHPEIYCFTWHEMSHKNKKWAGKAYGWSRDITKDKGRLYSSSWPSEQNVISGNLRESLQEIPPKNTSDYYLMNISTNGGPGNQVVGIKESLIMASMLHRQFVAPPIVQHYVLNRKYGRYNSYKHWNFSEIYDYKAYTVKDLKDCKNMLDAEDKQYCVIRKDLESQLRMENIVDVSHLHKELLHIRNFRNENDYTELAHKNEKALVIHNLYNNTAISECFWNGCDTCDINREFEQIYSNICANFDFSSKIKDFGDAFIKNIFGKNKFLCLHIRYPDQASGSCDIKKINKLYNEGDIKQAVELLCIQHNIDMCNVFIATCNQPLIKSSALHECVLLDSNPIYNELESFIEQYIATQSTCFVYTGGIHAKPDHTHLRSTWSSFVLDYRNHRMNIPTNKNVYLTNYFQENKVQ